MSSNTPSVTPRDGLATVDEAMDFLSVCRTTAYAMMKDGQLPSVQIRTSRRIPWAALHKLTADATPEAGSDR